MTAHTWRDGRICLNSDEDEADDQWLARRALILADCRPFELDEACRDLRYVLNATRLAASPRGGWMRWINIHRELGRDWRWPGWKIKQLVNERDEWITPALENAIDDMKDSAELHGRPTWMPCGVTAETPSTKGPIVYAVESIGSGRVKVGFTSRCLRVRAFAIATHSPFQVRAIGYWPGTRRDEAEWHRDHEADRRHGEWFEMTPAVLASVARLSVMK